MTRAAWLQFAALSVIWGLPYFFIKIALTELSPAWVAFARVALGAVILVCCVPRGDWAALRGRIPAVCAIGLTDIALPFLLIANGERSVSSSLTGLILSAIPIAVTVLALASDRHERLARAQVAGLLLGIAGVAALLGFSFGKPGAGAGGVVMIFAAMLSYSIGIMMIRDWFRGVPMLATAAAMLVVAAVMLAPPALREMPAHPPGVATLVSVVMLGALCTAAAYVLYFSLIAHAGAIRASVVTYLNPAVAALLGVVVLHEPLTATAIAGLLLIIAGSWLSTNGRPPQRLVDSVRPNAAPRVAGA